jgi:hypothetical protein
LNSLISDAVAADNHIAAARLKSITAPRSALSFTTLPTSWELILTDAVYEAQFRLRYGLSPVEHGPHRCGACQKAVDLQLHPWHHLVCQALKGGPMTKERHNEIVRLISRWLTACGATCTTRFRTERKEADEEKRLPDLDVRMGAKRWLMDATIRHPAAVSNARAAAKQVLATAEKAEREKQERYEELARKENAKFVPIALETFGGFGDKVAKFFEEFRAESKRLCIRWVPFEHFRDIDRLIALELQRGNAAVVRAGMRRSSGV